MHIPLSRPLAFLAACLISLAARSEKVIAHPASASPRASTESLARRDSLPDPDVFTVATWNLLNFDNTASRVNNVIQVLRTTKPDLVALQEITSSAALQAIVAQIPQYDYFYATYISNSQRLAYLYNKEAIEVVSVKALSATLTGDPSGFQTNAAGRLPYVFEFVLKKGDGDRRITAINIHAKAFDDRDSYLKRQGMATGIYNAILGNEQAWGHVILLGDYNDDLDVSIYANQPTPYKPFIDAGQRFVPLTLELSKRRFSSTVRYSEMIDHIMTTGYFYDFVTGDAEDVRVHRPDSYISNYSATSDHYPVLASFDMNLTGTSTEEEWRWDGESTGPTGFVLMPAYPNPFNPVTRLRFSLRRPATLRIEVFDVMGRRVGLLADGPFASGSHDLEFDAAGLSSGIYRIVVGGEGWLQSTSVTLVR